jgi:hypothetical protein
MMYDPIVSALLAEDRRSERLQQARRWRMHRSATSGHTDRRRLRLVAGLGRVQLGSRNRRHPTRLVPALQPNDAKE